MPTIPKRHRFLRVILFLFSLFLVGVYIGIDHIAPYIILKPQRRIHYAPPKDKVLTFNTLDLKTAEGFALSNYHIYSQLDTTFATIIFAHGIGGMKEPFLPVAKMLAERGYASVLFDLRAQGQSEGDYCTYGFHEKEDIKRIIDLLKAQNADLPVGVWGSSLGGAVALQALEYDERIAFGIIESTFAEMRQIVHDYAGRLLPFMPTFVVDRVLYRATQIAGFQANDVRPAQSAKQIEQPVFYGHGEADKRISCEYGKAIFANLASVDKELHIVPNAGHMNVSRIGGKAYWEAIWAFLRRQK